MTDQEIDALAQRISNLGRNTKTAEFLAALGIVVTNALDQLDEQRSIATVGWIASLTRAVMQREERRKAN